MYQKILVPLDGSKRAERILPHVEALVRCLDAELILLRVFKADFTQVDDYGHDPEFYESIRANCKEEAVIYLTKLQEKLLRKGFRLQVLAEEGPVVSTILSIAEREDADLIAMASHGRTGLSRVVFGSITHGVLHEADRPLLIVRAEGD